MNSKHRSFIGGPSDQFRPSVIPTGWEWVRLSDVSRLESGHTPDRKQPEYWDGNIQWVSLQDTSRLDEDSISDTAFSVTELGIANSSARVLPAGTVIFSRTATVGKATILAADMATSQDFANWVCGARIHNRYLMYVLRAMDQTWSSLMAGSTHNTIYMPDFKRMCILLPPPVEQMKIAALLSAWDRGIRHFSDLIAAKLRYKQGLVQQLLLGEKRLKGLKARHDSGSAILDFDKESLVSLEVEFGLTGRSYQEGIPAIGDCPSGWTRHIFRDVFEVIERPARMNDNETYQLVTAKRYRGGIVPRERLRGDQIKTKTQFFVGAGDFLISKRQIIHGACGLVPAYLDGAVVSNEYACLLPNEQLDPGFLNYLAHSRYFQQTCFHSSVGVALEKMIFRLEQWLKHVVNLPPLDEQRAIARCLSTMDREILLLARQRRLLREQKKWLMKKLLTGEVRVCTGERITS